MIIVVGHLTIDPSKREDALAAIAAGVAATREESGNLEYGFSADLTDPNRFNLLERWDDQAAIDAHMATPHLAEFLTAIGPCVSGSVEIVQYEVSGSKKVM